MYDIPMKTPLGTEHVGHVVEIKHNGEGGVIKKLITAVNTSAGVYKFKYADWHTSISDKNGFSPEEYNDGLKNRWVVKFHGSLSQPFGLVKEIKLFVVSILHGILERWGFNLERE